MTCQALSPLSPPSTSMTGSRPRSSHSRRKRADLGQHRRQELLPAKAGVDGHDQDDAAEVEHVLDLRQRRRRVQHHAGGLSRDRGYATACGAGGSSSSARNARADDRRRPAAKVVEVALGLDDHQMDVERLRRSRGAPPRRRPGRSSGSGRTGRPSHRHGSSRPRPCRPRAPPRRAARNRPTGSTARR